jgi:hypothetical protein
MTIENDVARLRAADGMLLGRYKPVIEAKYGGALWAHVYRRIVSSFTPAMQESGLLIQRTDPEQELCRLRNVQRCEAAACAWLDRVLVGVDAGLAEVNRKRRACAGHES